MKSMVQISHDFLAPALHTQAVCVDATFGQGKDTAFFLNSNVSKVYAFDVQPALVEQGKAKFCTEKAEILNLSHEALDQALACETRPLDAVIFNFGWDPAQKGGIETSPESSVKGVLAAFERLRPKGRMALVFYPHPQGKAEEERVLAALKPLNGKMEVLMAVHPFQANAPRACLIQKRKDTHPPRSMKNEGQN